MGRFFIVAGILLGIVFLLFCPIFLEIDLYYDVREKKFGFGLYGYKIVKLLGGYALTYPGGIALHVSDKKAILIPYSELDNERKRFSFMRTFRLKSFVLTTETGAEYLLPVSVAHALLRVLFFAIGGKKEKIENNLWLTDGDVFRVALNCVLFFNLFILLRAFLKFLKEKFSSLWQKKIKESTT